jgi:hypothetical protein
MPKVPDSERHYAALLLIRREHRCAAPGPEGGTTCRDHAPDDPSLWCPHCIACGALDPVPQRPRVATARIRREDR